MWYYARNLTFALALIGAGLRPSAAHAQIGRAWAEVDRAMGRSGKPQPGEVQKYSFPRSDLRVTVDDVAVKPALALGSWVAFKHNGSRGQAMLMGDLVLTEDEVASVVARLQDAGLNQTALHNHLLRERPRIMYLHVEGHGDAVRLARGIRSALAATKTPDTAPAPDQGAPFSLDTTALAKALGHHGSVNGGVYQVSVARAEAVRVDTMQVPPSMGLATAINFQPTSDGRVATTGDFVLRGDEVNPVMRTLNQQGISVTALHSHMLTEEPRLFFMHFWANDDALRLANGLRAALERTESKAAAS